MRWTSSILALYRVTDVRAITPRCNGSSRPTCVVISSVTPSLTNSSSARPLRFWKGRTASMMRPGYGFVCRRSVDRHFNDDPIKNIASKKVAAYHTSRTLFFDEVIAAEETNEAEPAAEFCVLTGTKKR